MKITYLLGDLFEYVPAKLKSDGKNVLIPHVVNDVGAFGAGFVLPLGKKYPAAKDAYLTWGDRAKACEGDDPRGVSPFSQGNTEALCVAEKTETSPAIFVAHMCAQTLGGPRPLNYSHLVTCMQEVARSFGACEIHAPMFGSGLAGGDWNFIEDLIEDIWLAERIPVTIHYLPQFLPSNWKLPK